MYVCFCSSLQSMNLFTGKSIRITSPFGKSDDIICINRQNLLNAKQLHEQNACLAAEEHQNKFHDS